MKLVQSTAAAWLGSTGAPVIEMRMMKWAKTLLMEYTDKHGVDEQAGRGSRS